ncbi:hypothetical protein MPTK1_2g19090 [Marchantia polymorpha subsp. ruderalis]|uniref:Uncharacterized protein n=1 Tax=Marchantia polymorpha TaxID=3197 RepID=A0A2R6W8Q9_MARPO|nr:hypothetical protein MARPO_0128s0024 [Marchantia polymorpha]BBN02899.1 hypothetical protein Mp_2g19090 [Marchantia polymorpha subsp. ruderalis]|eukprot:PTQ30202.1 hypothetical protein MARPO_0128s0024 [Marchantia polymorpha]
MPLLCPCFVKVEFPQRVNDLHPTVRINDSMPVCTQSNRELISFCGLDTTASPMRIATSLSPTYFESTIFSSFKAPLRT